MAIDKILGNTDLDSVADSVFSAVSDSVSEIKAMQKRKAAENVQIVIQALKKIESDLQDKYDGVTTVIEKRVASIKNGQDGRNGVDGKAGKDGRPGRDGATGPRGADGLNGRDGRDGMDGVSVTDARIDFDGSLVISLSSGREINVGEVVAPDLAERIKVITNGGGTSQGVLDTLTSLQDQINALVGLGVVNYVGTWNASTNSPTIVAGTGDKGDYYVVSVAGSTNIDGQTLWGVGDWIIFNGAVWQRVDGGSTGNFTTLTTSSTVTHNGGTANGVAYLNGSKVLTTGSALTFDGAILSANAACAIQVLRSDNARGGSFYADNTGTHLTALASGNDPLLLEALGAGDIRFRINNSEQMRLTSTGLGIGTSSPTNALSVSGNANITGNTTLGDASTDTVTVNGYMGVGGAAATNRAVSVVNTALSGTTQSGVVANITGTSGATTGVNGLAAEVGTAAAVFTAADVTGLIVQNAFKGAGSTITNQHGVRIVDQTQGTNNYGITSLVSSGTDKWNIYASGTAANYFAGNVGIGTSSPASTLDVRTSTGATIIAGRTSNVGATSVPGTLNFTAPNASGSARTWAGIRSVVGTATQGSEACSIVFSNQVAGAYTDTLTINSSGNLGIGTSSPLTTLQVGSTSITSIPASSFSTHQSVDGDAVSYFFNSIQSTASSANETTQLYLGWRDAATGVAVAPRIISGKEGDYTTAGNAKAYLAFSTVLSNTAIERMRIDSSGNLGLGVTPSAWSSGKSFEIGNAGDGLAINYGLGLNLNRNAYFNSGYKYGTTDFASRYAQANGQHQWFTAPSGTAGNAITFTQAMTLDASGNLNIGVTSSQTGRVSVLASTSQPYASFDAPSAGYAYAALKYNGTAFGYFGQASAIVFGGANTDYGLQAVGNLLFASGGITERMRINSSGNVGIGTSSPGARLDVSTASGNTAIISRSVAATNASVQIAGNGNTPGTTSFDLIQDNTFAYVYQRDNKPIVFGTNNTERMRLDASGNLGLGVTPSAYGTRGFDVGAFVGLSQNSAGAAVFAFNNFQNSAGNYIYKTTNAAARYDCGAFGSAAHAWYTASSGTAGNAITFTQAMTLDASGRLLVGLTSSNTALGGKLQVEGTTDAFSSLVRYSSSAGGAPVAYLARSKSATLGTNTIVASGDTLGSIAFSGANGTGYSDAAYIQAFVDGTPGASADMPGRLVFATSADGSATPAERMRIDSSGNLIQTVNTTAATLATNNTLTFSIVDNSTLRISVRGSDGTTRTATVALT